MTRIINEKEHAFRRNEILDAARRLVYTKGYEQMTIQDILDMLGISKGAFYHYFNSKQDLLEALIDRLLDEALAFLAPVVQDPDLPALEKFRRYFSSAVSWKAGQRDMLLALMHTWYADENAIVRQKVKALGLQKLSPYLTEMILQGIREGSIHTPFPDQISKVIFSIFMSMGDAISADLMTILPESGAEQRAECLRRVEETLGIYTDALERVLGVSPGSIKIADREQLRVFVETPAQ